MSRFLASPSCGKLPTALDSRPHSSVFKASLLRGVLSQVALSLVLSSDSQDLRDRIGPSWIIQTNFST